MLDNTPDSPKTIVQAEGWIQINNHEKIRKICETVLEENPKMVEQYKRGKKKVFNAVVGAVAKKTERMVNMGTAAKIIEELLNK